MISDTLECAIEDVHGIVGEGESLGRGSFFWEGISVELDLKISAGVEIRDDGLPYVQWATYSFWFGVGAETVLVSRTQRRKFSASDLEDLWRHVLAHAPTQFRSALSVALEAAELAAAVPEPAVASKSKRL